MTMASRGANVALVLGLWAVLGCTPDTPVGPSPRDGGGTGTGGRPQTSQTQGCASFGQAGGGPMCGLPGTLGSPAADQIFTVEVALQRAFWTNITVANVAPLNDCGFQTRNALADPASRSIFFGAHLFGHLVGLHGNVLPVAGVLAHEWGHQTQFQFGWQTNPVRNMELEADAFAGYFMALAKGWAWPYMHSYFQSVFDSGDYAFNSPSHHGTPNQRHAMARVGFDTATQAVLTGRPLSYFDLHAIFTNATRRLQGLAAPGVSTHLADLAETVVRGEASLVLDGAAGRPDEMPGDEAARRRLWPR